MAEQNAAAVVCAVCHKPIERGRGRYSVEDQHYHPDCYDRERTTDGTELSGDPTADRPTPDRRP